MKEYIEIFVDALFHHNANQEQSRNMNFVSIMQKFVREQYYNWDTQKF